MPTPFLHPFARPTSDDFVTIVRGEGAIVFDAQGRRYVDGLASLWYCNIGHGRTEVVDAVAAQMRQLEAYQTFDIFTNEPAERISATLAELAPIPDARVFLVGSGSEAVDSAIKLARLAHHLRGDERHLIVSRRHAYHGVTLGGTSAQGLPPNREGFGPLLDRVQIEHDDLADARRVFAERGSEIALVLAEPVIGSGGVYPPPPGYLSGLRELCDEHGALLALDEVICGFGRLGAWWGSQRYDVAPDLVTFAKGVTSGYLPLGGVLVGSAVRAPLEADPDFVLRHGHTYSGHPASCVAGLKVIEITEREALVGRALAVGQRLADGLCRLRDDGLLSEVRGDGAMWAAMLPARMSAIDVRAALLERGVIARPHGTDGLIFCPPLVIADVDLDHCVEALGEAVAAVRG